MERAEGTRSSAGGFEAAYSRHYKSVYRYLLGLTRSTDDAEELTAETFERAYRAGLAGTADAEPTLPWLLLTARRIATDRWRRARRLAVLRFAARPATVGVHEQTEFWLWFDAVSRVLSDRQREVLLLRYQRDLSDADIASIIGISSSGVRSLVARALETLRAHPDLLR